MTPEVDIDTRLFGEGQRLDQIRRMTTDACHPGSDQQRVKVCQHSSVSRFPQCPDECCGTASRGRGPRGPAGSPHHISRTGVYAGALPHTRRIRLFCGRIAPFHHRWTVEGQMGLSGEDSSSSAERNHQTSVLAGMDACLGERLPTLS